MQIYYVFQQEYLPFPQVCSRRIPQLLTSPSEWFEFISKVSLKYQSNTLWQWLHTRNGMWFEIDINLNSREYTGHQILYLSQRWKFIALFEDPVVFFLLLLLLFYLFAHNKYARTLNCRYHWATILEKLWFFFCCCFFFLFHRKPKLIFHNSNWTEWSAIWAGISKFTDINITNEPNRTN